MTNQNIKSRDLESQNINPGTSTPECQPWDIESQDVESPSQDIESQDVESPSGNVESANQSENNPSQNPEKKCIKNSDKSMCLFHICFIIIMIAIVAITVYLTEIHLANPCPKGENCTNDYIV